MLISHTERGFKGRVLLDISSFLCFTKKYCQICEFSLQAMFHHCAFLFFKLTVRVLIWGYCMCSSISRVSFKFIYCTSTTCLGVFCLRDVSMSKCVMLSAVWDRTRHASCTTYQCKYHFFRKSHHPWQLVLLTTASQDTCSHSSVRAAYSKAIMCAAGVWKHLGVFMPVILASDEFYLQPSSSSNKSFSRSIKMIDGQGS